MMNDFVPTRTALAEHHRAAHSAEQLSGKQVIVLGLVTGRSAAVLFLIFSCTSSNKSLSTMAGMLSGITISLKWFSPMYRLFVSSV